VLSAAVLARRALKALPPERVDAVRTRADAARARARALTARVAARAGRRGGGAPPVS
jgi:hypothetical protein